MGYIRIFIIIIALLSFSFATRANSAPQSVRLQLNFDIAVPEEPQDATEWCAACAARTALSTALSVALPGGGLIFPIQLTRQTQTCATSSGSGAFQRGESSYYSHELAGNKMANGQRFNPERPTAAHRSLPLGTRIRVTNNANGRSTIVTVTDRGPYARGRNGRLRILDLSLKAARDIGMIQSGHANVTIEVCRSNARTSNT